MCHKDETPIYRTSLEKRATLLKDTITRALRVFDLIMHLLIFDGIMMINKDCKKISEIKLSKESYKDILIIFKNSIVK